MDFLKLIFQFRDILKYLYRLRIASNTSIFILNMEERLFRNFIKGILNHIYLFALFWCLIEK